VGLLISRRELGKILLLVKDSFFTKPFLLLLAFKKKVHQESLACPNSAKRSLLRESAGLAEFSIANTLSKISGSFADLDALGLGEFCLDFEERMFGKFERCEGL